MAFALTKFKAYGRYIDEPITTRCHQVVELEYTRGATGDVDADLGDFTAGSTFWAAATGDATYGDLAIAARPVLQKIVAKGSSLASHELIGDSQPLVQLLAATAAANYIMTNAETYPLFAPIITHKTAEATPATVRCVFEWINKVEERAERYGV